jgi:hypothetical protein
MAFGDGDRPLPGWRLPLKRDDGLTLHLDDSKSWEILPLGAGQILSLLRPAVGVYPRRSAGRQQVLADA